MSGLFEGTTTDIGVNPFGGAGPSVKMPGFMTEMSDRVLGWFQEMADTVTTGVGEIDFSGLVTVMNTVGTDTIAGLQDGVVERWLILKTWFGLLDTYVFDAIGDVTSSIKQKGIDLIKGAHDGVIERWLTLKAWAGHLKDYVFDAIGDVTASLLQKGIDLITGLMSGWNTKSLELQAWANNLGGWIAEQVGNLGSILYGAGADLVQGFINGVNDKLGPLRAIVNDLISIVNSIPGVNVGGAGDTSGGAGTGQQVPMHAMGGFTKAGMALVGERGPELVSLPPRSYVHTASQTRGMMGGGDTYYLVDLSNAVVGRGAMQEIQKMIRDGDVATFKAVQGAGVGAMRR